MIATAILTCVLALSVSADESPVILMGPQNYTYPENSVAIYTVKASGKDLSAVWYMKWNGVTYNLSDNSNPAEPWEGYAGENYGGNSTDGTTFTWFFGGIGHELDGAEIWCTVKSGNSEIATAPARITVSGTVSPPEIISMPSSVTVSRGALGEARCVARANGNAQLSFLWYETSTGKLENIQAIMPEETGDTLFFDTSKAGVRYYVCMVSSTDGGCAYSSVLEVNVQEAPPDTAKPAFSDTEKTPEQTAAPVTGTMPPVETGVDTPVTAPADNTDKTDKTGKWGDADDSTEEGLPLWILIAVGVGAAACGAVVAFLITRSKKNN